MYTLDDSKGYVRLVDHMGDDRRIVDAARTTSDTESDPDRDAKLIRYLVRNKHTSPLEFVRFTFEAKMPIFVARQWVRHRTASINEFSQRYSEVEDSDFYVPSLARISRGGQAKKNRQASGEPLSHGVQYEAAGEIIESCDAAFASYRRLLDMGVARELARAVLPLNTYTRWYWTTDLHNLLNFIGLRDHSHAQWEIAQYARTMKELIRPIVPVALAAWEESR